MGQLVSPLLPHKAIVSPLCGPSTAQQQHPFAHRCFSAPGRVELCSFENG